MHKLTLHMPPHSNHSDSLPPPSFPLKAGLASLPKLRKVRDPAAKEAITAMAGFEEEARKAHRGMFQYGDPGDSDDEQDMPRPQGAWGKR